MINVLAMTVGNIVFKLNPIIAARPHKRSAQRVRSASMERQVPLIRTQVALFQGGAAATFRESCLAKYWSHILMGTLKNFAALAAMA